MYAVIMAGGRGTRFWPRSRTTTPKQLLDITGEKTMIQQTVERILPVVDKENILIVTNMQQIEALKKQLPDIREEYNRRTFWKKYCALYLPCCCKNYKTGS